MPLFLKSFASDCDFRLSGLAAQLQEVRRMPLLVCCRRWKIGISSDLGSLVAKHLRAMFLFFLILLIARVEDLSGVFFFPAGRDFNAAQPMFRRPRQRLSIQ